MLRLNRGFTLIELMIVVAIIGISVLLGVPSYLDYVVTTNRIDGREKINELLLEQERFRMSNRVYTDDLTDLGYASPLYSDNEHYVMSADDCDDESNVNRCVEIIATPVAGGSQVDDGVISMNTRGEISGNWDN
ncbi:MAG: type IV pilin protein [Pseudomonadota bacterium]